MARWMATVAAGLVLLRAGVAEGQEWTRFRGPNGTGISSANLPTEFQQRDFRWRAELPGEGHSAPVVWGNRIFITGAEEAKGRRHDLCLNAADGRILWEKSFDFKPYRHHEFNTCASSTPAVDESRVYFLWGTPQQITLEAFSHDGRELWRCELGALAIQHGIGTSPVVVGNVVVVGIYQEQEGPAGFIAGIDRATGKVLWKRARSQNQSASYATPFVYEGGGRTELICASTAHGITSLNPRTGEVYWETSGLFKLRTVASPVLAGGLIFQTCGQGDGSRQAVAVRPGGKSAPEVVYRLTRGPSYCPTPIALGDRIYAWGDGGIVTCLKAATGDVVWQERVGGNFFGSPVCIGGRLYAVSARGELVVVEASDRFKVLGRTDLGEPSNSTPAVSGGTLYVRTRSHLIALGGKS